jgi:hypothetical protein
MKLSLRGLAALTATFMMFVTAPPALAWVDHTATVTGARAAHPPVLSDGLADPAWKGALHVSGFYDYETRQPAAHRTDVYFMYDDTNVYVGFEAEQSGVPIVAPQSVDHAGLSTDDHVSFMVDTSGNFARSFVFVVSPKGIRYELSSESSRYSPQWSAVARRTSTGYWAVMEIPLSALNVRGGGQVWHVNFGRYIVSKNVTSTWAYEPAMYAPGEVQSWPSMQIEVASAAVQRRKPSLDVYGLAAAGSDRRVYQDGIGDFIHMNPRAAGVDFTYPLTDSISFVGALNPDFSGIENDQTTISPQEFEKNYQEYRPFFAQGSNFVNSMPQFDVGPLVESLFYTPGIGVFDRGAKIEGTAGHTALGLLSVSGPSFNDTAFGYAYGTPDGSFSTAVQGVQSNHEGIRDFAGGWSAVRMNPHSGESTVFSYETDSGDRVTSPDQARDLMLTEYIMSQRWIGAVAYKDAGPQFNPQDGYMQLNDVRGPLGLLTYNGAGSAGSNLKDYKINVLADRFLDRAGQVHEADFNAGASVTLKNLLSFAYNDGLSSLRTYDSGYPDYANGVNAQYNQQTVSAAYQENSANPVKISYSWGPFQDFTLQQIGFSVHRQLGAYGIGLDYAGSLENGSALDSQWLRRLSLTRSFGKDASLAVGLRNINGNGGFALPGTDIALSYQQRFVNGSMLYISYGTPAAPSTLHRLILKYVFHAGEERS